MPDLSDKGMSDYQRMRRHVLAGLIAVIAVFLIFGRSAQSEMSHEHIEYIGRMLILIGIGGRLWSTLYIGGRKSAEVVQTGPYSIMRNPLYFFSTVAVAGVGAQVGSVVFAVSFAILCWAAFTVVTLREEAFLAAKLGQRYLDYKARVPRFFPDPRLYRDQDEVTFRPNMLSRTLIDGLAFFVSVPLFEFIEELQEHAIIPTLFHVF